MTEAVEIRSASSPEGSTATAVAPEPTDAPDGDHARRRLRREAGGEEEDEEATTPDEPGWKGRKDEKRWWKDEKESLFT